MSSTIDRDLALHLEALRKQKGDTVKVEEVGDVVRSLLASLSGDVSAGDLKLYGEVQALAAYIHNAKVEIAALRPQDIQHEYIASATDELDAIVGATENATNSILDAAEKLDSLSSDMTPDVGQKLTEQITLIYEACNFQDITGQRITKVVRALKHIEERIDALVLAFGPEVATSAPGTSKPDETAPLTDQDLLNGPQLPDQAHDQASIDALFDNI
ncbi:protein phosphatase CheZ [Telmatospirillum siberiense]|uniref:Chemotaxis protein CheZ n=1 Tax=Telmatospirillum siberiense TaxID=382514 RepID=A0A2N3Q029_9PROT|nr:protein phosphatase CheZ [Telmatospirillum siberiense]PKU26017.1 chemotaxis protein CheZ [Telmatospirillum siberiense]